MSKQLSQRATREDERAVPSVIHAAQFAACALAACVLTSALAALAPGIARAQVRPADAQSQQQRRQQPAVRKDSPFDEEKDDEEESESVPRGEAVVRARVTDPATVLRKARFIYVRSLSAFVSGREVEDSLRKRKEFQAWGMVITRNDSDADLIIEITRKTFTRRFTFTVLDPRTMEIVASGKTRSVLFGKHIPTKIAEKFANRVKVFRPYPPVQ